MNDELRDAIEWARKQATYYSVWTVGSRRRFTLLADAAERSMDPSLPKCPVCGAGAEEWKGQDGWRHCGCREHGAGYSSKTFDEAREHWCKMMGRK